MPIVPTVLLASRDVYVATFGEALLVHFRVKTDASSVPAWVSGVNSIARTGRKAVFLAVIEPDSVPPDEGTRRAFTKFFEDHADRLGGFVIAYVAEGFRAAAARTVISTIVNVLPRFRLAFPRHVVKTVEEAVPLAARCAPGLDPVALGEAFATLRRMAPTT